MEASCKHYLITRFNIRIASMLTKQLDAIDISRDEKYLENRFCLFFSYTVPSVVGQTNKNFKWIVLFSDNTPRRFKDKMSQLTEQYPFIVALYIKDDENSTDILNNYILREKCEWIITSRLDNDDALATTYIESVQQYFSKNGRKKHALIFNDGYQYEQKSCVLTRYHFPKNHFSSLFSEYSSVPDNILNYGHMDIDKKIKLKEINTKDPHWMEIVHDTNVTNRMHFSLKDVVTDKSDLGKFGIFGIEVATKPQALKRYLMLKPDNVRVLLKKYGLKKTTVKVIEKIKRRMK